MPLVHSLEFFVYYRHDRHDIGMFDALRLLPYDAPEVHDEHAVFKVNQHVFKEFARHTFARLRQKKLGNDTDLTLETFLDEYELFITPMLAERPSEMTCAIVSVATLSAALRSCDEKHGVAVYVWEKGLMTGVAISSTVPKAQRRTRALEPVSSELVTLCLY